MARIRTIKPEFPQSETLGKASREARLLFVNIFTIADDEGRARASSRLLASLLYPFDNDAGDLIQGWIAELERIGAIRTYEVEGVSYLDIPKWLEHQKIDKPSKSRLPPYSRMVAKPREASAADLVSRTKDLVSRNPPLIPPPGKIKNTKPGKTRLDPSWRPSADDVAVLTKLGLTHDERETFLTNHIEYWTGPDAKGGGLKSCWSRCYRQAGRMFAPGIIARRTRSGQPAGHRRGPGSIADAYRELMAESGDVQREPDVADSGAPAHPQTTSDLFRNGAVQRPDNGQILIDADDWRRMPEGPPGTESSHGLSNGTNGRHQANGGTLPAQAGEISGGRGPARSPDPTISIPLVASVGRTGGEARTPLPAAVQNGGTSDGLDIPTFLRRTS